MVMYEFPSRGCLKRFLKAPFLGDIAKNEYAAIRMDTPIMYDNTERDSQCTSSDQLYENVGNDNPTSNIYLHLNGAGEMNVSYESLGLSTLHLLRFAEHIASGLDFLHTHQVIYLVY